jgi:excisionase family DNA binding protein
MSKANHLLTIPEVATQLGVSRRTVQRRIASGELRAIKLGDRKKSPVRVIPEELREWLRSVPQAGACEPSMRPH